MLKPDRFSCSQKIRLKRDPPVGLNDSYHNLAPSTNVRKKIWTFTPSGNACVYIQSFVLSKCVSASLSGVPAYSGLKCDQFNCSICWIGCMGAGWLRNAGGCTGCIGGWGACSACRAKSTWGAGGTEELVVLHLTCLFIIYACV